MIGCKDGCICSFVLDENYVSQYEYRPDVVYLNTEIQKWNAMGISFCGIVHSHLYGFNQPSESDRVYARRLFLLGSNITSLYFPIVTFDSCGNTQIDFYQYLPGNDTFERIIINEY